jgi:hypothetical protein
LGGAHLVDFLEEKRCGKRKISPKDLREKAYKAAESS